ncbi:hypothetical protein [Paraburkholderia sp. UCT2]|uniref:hypothetical protein n=1 Tax=Paraburkholderia sp. UCT2 TaxID=2615208 RepID=UPI001655FF16|nr:hypothetical protein [Paraburkholderia sp. UCT2]MBC8729464.1 hypothetical protein [Paraburkholderia sp. UCT2]
MSEIQGDKKSVVVDGQFQTKQSHEIGAGFLKAQLDAFEAAALFVSHGIITDEFVRQQYKAHIKRISTSVRQAVENGNLSVKEAAEYCSQVRDQLFVEYRKYTSAIGIAGAEAIKLKSRGFEYYLNKYANAKYGVDFKVLNGDQRATVYFETILSAGRDNVKVTKGTKIQKGLGVTAIIVVAIYAVGAIINAKDKIREAAKQGDIIAAGFIGGAIAGGAVSFLCGPAEPVCAVATVSIGAAMGSQVGEHIQDWYDSALTSFKSIIAN